jgi:hypothetical protein
LIIIRIININHTIILSIVPYTAHKLFRVWYHPVDLGPGKIEARVLLLKSLKEYLLLNFSLSEWIECLMSLASLAPCLSLVHLLQLYVQFLVLDHPVALRGLDLAAQVLIQKGWETLQTHGNVR